MATEATTERADERAPQPSFWERVWALPWRRIVLGVLGVGALIVGAIVAWRAESATTLLIVAAISQATVKTPTRMILAQGAKSWSFTSPANFRGARALAPGSYRVEWRSSGIPKIAKAEILAEDTFEWSAARAS